MPGLPRVPKTRIERLEIENFKSYRGKQQVGPFHAFTAVIGPNGSGKSNIMDAISFVLGVKGAQLRGSLKELLYSYTSGQDVECPERGHVKLILETEGQDSTSFQRSIVPGRDHDSYSSQYAVNDCTTSWACYEDHLKSFGVLVKARNFLVFQGDIEAVAGKQPLELTKLFESISGSDGFKADYEKFNTERTAAQERLAFVQSKKKNTAAEKRQKREQKVEADRHVKLEEELEALKSTYYLWQLYHSQQDANKAGQELEAKETELKEAAKVLKATETAVKEKRKALASLNKNRANVEKSLKKKHKEADNQDPAQLKIKLEVENLKKKLLAKERELKEEKGKVSKGRADIDRLQEESARLEEEINLRQAAPANNEGRLSDQILDEFLAVKEEARAKTNRARTEMSAQQHLQDTDRRALEMAQSNLKRIEQQLEKTQSSKMGLSQQQAKQEQDLRDSREKLKEIEARLSGFDMEGKRNESEKRAIKAKLQRVEESLQDLKAHAKQNKKDARARQEIAQMKILYKDLGKVTQQSYSLAVAVAMGRTMEHVVVENENIAKDCIKQLKDRRAPPMTFLPLRTIKAYPPHERLRSLGGTARLALDLMEFDPKLERAFISACGSTLVCDTEREAKDLAFGSRGERHKVVTKAGLVISRDGAMTGGGELAAQAARYYEGQYQQLEQEKEMYLTELAKCPNENSIEASRERLKNEMTSLKAKIRMLQLEIGRLQTRAGQSLEANPLLEEKEKQQEQIDRLQEEMTARQKKIDTIEERINQTEDAIYADLSRKAGVENLREYMKQNTEEVEQQRAKLKTIRLNLSKVKNQLNYELKREPTLKVTALEVALKGFRTRLVELEQQTRDAQAAAKALQMQSKADSDELEALKQQVLEGEGELKDLQRKESKQTAAGNAIHQDMKRLEGALEALALKQTEILKNAQLEQVALPRQGDAEAMETDSPDQDAAPALQCLDFDSLTDEHKAMISEIEREQLDSEFSNRIEEQQAALSKVLPNLKASEQYQEAKEEDDREKAELDEARQAHRDAAKAFHNIRQQRAEAYIKAFDHIKDVINPIYKDLTKSNAHPMGGTAYLSMLSNGEDEPFLSGASFTAMPPSKRWRQMEALSGGEKVDAALDASNVAKVANYIREKTRTDDGMEQFQAVVISLKDYFFSKADAVVGVTKSPQYGCSQTFTLDLNQFGEPEQ